MCALSNTSYDLPGPGAARGALEVITRAEAVQHQGLHVVCSIHRGSDHGVNLFHISGIF